MHATWRWFGPQDAVGIDEIRQAGAGGVVTALHHVPPGVVWSPEEIAARQRDVARRADGRDSGLSWDVVESLPVSEAIKKGGVEREAHLAAYRQSLANLAAAGIETVCYNFMPVLDWTRTDLAFRVGHGGTCMRFDLVDFAVFDIHVLARPGAAESFAPDVVAAAGERYAAMDADGCAALAANVTSGLPGAAESFTLADVRAHLAEYAEMGAETLRANLVAFLEAVAPEAERLGVRLCCHPDDPPFPLLGLPRVMSTEADYAAVMAAVDTPANGITLCSGSLGARGDVDIPGMMARLGDRVHFLHMRNVALEEERVPGSFHEAEHLGGSTDMVAFAAAVVAEERRRRTAGRADHSIPFRPDHGQDILDDLTRKAQPGYPAIGRLKGLAELRGIFAALDHPAGRSTR